MLSAVGVGSPVARPYFISNLLKWEMASVTHLPIFSLFGYNVVICIAAGVYGVSHIFTAMCLETLPFTGGHK